MDDGSGDRLVGSLVGREPGVPMRAEQLPLAELVGDLGKERLEWLAHGSFVGRPVGLEPFPGVVGLDATEPRERRRGPATKRGGVGHVADTVADTRFRCEPLQELSAPATRRATPGDPTSTPPLDARGMRGLPRAARGRRPSRGAAHMTPSGSAGPGPWPSGTPPAWGNGRAGRTG